jgi:hypothetical protein
MNWNYNGYSCVARGGGELRFGPNIEIYGMPLHKDAIPRRLLPRSLAQM